MISSQRIVEAAIQILDDAEAQGFDVLTIQSVGLLNKALFVDDARLSEESIKTQIMSRDAIDVLLQGLGRSDGRTDVGVVQHKAPDQKASVSVFLRGQVGHRGGQVDAIFEPPIRTYDVNHFLLFGPSNLKRYKGDYARDGRRRMRRPEQELEDAEALIALARLTLGLE